MAELQEFAEREGLPLKYVPTVKATVGGKEVDPEPFFGRKPEPVPSITPQARASILADDRYYML